VGLLIGDNERDGDRRGAAAPSKTRDVCLLESTEPAVIFVFLFAIIEDFKRGLHRGLGLGTAVGFEGYIGLSRST